MSTSPETTPPQPAFETLIDKIMPRFPKAWHHQLRRIAADTHTAFLTEPSSERVLYSIKSGRAMYVVRVEWINTNVNFLKLSIEVIHSRGVEAIRVSE